MEKKQGQKIGIKIALQFMEKYLILCLEKCQDKTLSFQTIFPLLPFHHILVDDLIIHKGVYCKCLVLIS